MEVVVVYCAGLKEKSFIGSRYEYLVPVGGTVHRGLGGVALLEVVRVHTLPHFQFGCFLQVVEEVSSQLSALAAFLP